MTLNGGSLRGVGVFLIATGVSSGILLAFIPLPPVFGEESLTDLARIFFQGLFVVGGAFAYWRGGQYASRAAAERITSRHPSEVLYLRSFRTDPSAAEYVAFEGSRLVRGLATPEEQLADVVRPIGELIAIGAPGERLPKPGAAHVYASDAEWKAAVTQRMQHARLVIVRAGLGENLLWEIREAVSVVKPEKLLILVLGFSKKQYASFRAKVYATLSLSLPAEMPERSRSRPAFIGFASDWSPMPIAAAPRPFMRRSVFNSLRREFTFALKPVFERCGTEWKAPPVAPIKLSLIALSAAGALALIADSAADRISDVRNRHAVERMKPEVASFEARLARIGQTIARTPLVAAPRHVPLTPLPTITFDEKRSNTGTIAFERLASLEASPAFDLPLGDDVVAELVRSPVAKDKRVALRRQYLIVYRTVALLEPRAISGPAFTPGHVAIALYLVELTNHDEIHPLGIAVGDTAPRLEYFHQADTDERHQAEELEHAARTSMCTSALADVHAKLIAVTGGRFDRTHC